MQMSALKCLIQGKKHAGKKALLAGYLIPLLRSQKPCIKETQVPTVQGWRIKSDEHVNATQFGGKDKLNLKLTVFFYLT